MDVPERLLAGGPWWGVTLLQVTLVAALGVLAWLATRRGGPPLRGAVVLAALGGLLIVPGLATIAPVWLQLPVAAHTAEAVPPIPRDAVRPSPLAAEPVVLPAAAGVDVQNKIPIDPADPTDPFGEFDPLADEEDFAAAFPLPAATAVPPADAGRPETAAKPLAGLLLAVWLAGALVYLARASVGLWLLYRRAWQARPVPEAEWSGCLGAPADPGGRPRVAVRESPAVASPLTLGVFRPVILLPTGWRTWAAGQLPLVLAHELAHVRRRDFLAGLVAEVAACLCWFHPLVRWLAGRLRLEQEYAADARAAAAAGDAMTYVRCLARLALEQGAGHGAPAPAFWRHRPEILRRIDMLRRNRDGLAPRLGRGPACGVVVLAAAACVAVSGVGPLRAIADGPAPDESKPDVAAPGAKAQAATDPHGDPLPAGTVARLGTTRWRAGATINFLAFGPEGKSLVTAGQDGSVRQWDLGTGKEVRRFARPEPAGAQPAPNRPGAPGIAVPRPPLAGAAATEAARERERKLAAEAAAANSVAQATATKARMQAAEAAAAVAEAKAKLDSAKPGVGADAAKQKLDAAKQAEQAAKEAEQATKARLEALRAELAVQARQRALVGGGGSATAVTDDGKTLAVSGGTAVRLYEVETGKELRTIEGPATGLVSLLFSPDGKTLAGRGGDDGVTMWDSASGRERRKIKAPTPPDVRTRAVSLRAGGEAPGLAFSPDSATLAVATTEFKEQNFTGRVTLWDMASEKDGRDFKSLEGATVSGLAFDPRGKALAYCSNGVVHACDVTTGDALFQVSPPDFAVGLSFSPDGRQLAVRGRAQQVMVCDGGTGKEQYRLGEPAADGRAIAVNVIGRFPTALETRTLAFSPDGRRIATAAGGTIRLWAAAGGKELPLADGHRASPQAVSLAADGKTAVSLGADRTLYRWETATGKSLGSVRVPQGAAALSPDARSLAVATPDGFIRLLDTAGGKEVSQFRTPSRGVALSFSPDGKLLAERAFDGAIRLYDPAKGTVVRQFGSQAANSRRATDAVAFAVPLAGSAAMAGLAFSPDGKLLASAAPASPFVMPPGAVPARGRPNGGVITLFDVSTGKAVRTIEPSVPASGFTFSPDGRVLATENADDSVTLWEVASGKERARLGGRAVAAAPVPGAMPGVARVFVAGSPGLADSAGPTAVAFSPDGRVLVARGPDRAVHTWDVDGGKDLGRFDGHDGRVETVSFSADGKSVATGSSDTTILVWAAAALRKDLPTPAAAEFPDAAADALWADLAEGDAGKAFQGLRKLVASPRQTVALLGERLRPADPIDPEKLTRWVVDLESDKFAVRQEAATSLVKAGEQVVPALRKVLSEQPTIETRLRVEGLLDKLTGGTLTGDQLRLVRGVEALERIGTPDARKVLETLAGGAAGALPTREARTALDRLGDK
jgi:WD40 repeat protein/beta-lactamase regulating signal transducer with metallopeptidase domain